LPRLADPWLTEVARLAPALLAERPDLPRPGPLAERWQLQRFYEALARALLAGEQPLLLLLDDAQCCDAETLDFLAFVLRFDAAARLLVLLTLRSEDAGAESRLPR